MKCFNVIIQQLTANSCSAAVSTPSCLFATFIGVSNHMKMRVFSIKHLCVPMVWSVMLRYGYYLTTLLVEELSGLKLEI